MGWYSFYRWRKSFDHNYRVYNRIYWYKEYVLKTPEQRAIEKKESKKQARVALHALGLMYSMIENVYGGADSIWR